MYNLNEIKYNLIEIICKSKTKKELLKALTDSICFVETNFGVQEEINSLVSAINEESNKNRIEEFIKALKGKDFALGDSFWINDIEFEVVNKKQIENKPTHPRIKDFNTN